MREAMQAFSVHQKCQAQWAQRAGVADDVPDKDPEASKWVDVISLCCQIDGTGDENTAFYMQTYTLGRIDIDGAGDNERYIVMMADGSRYTMTPDQVAGSIDDTKKHGPLILDRGFSTNSDMEHDDVPNRVAEIASERSEEDEKDLRKSIRLRNGRLDHGQYMRMPKEVSQLHAIGLSQHSTRANRIETLRHNVKPVERIEQHRGVSTEITGHRIIVTLDPQTRQTISTARASRIKRPHAILEYDQQKGKPEELVPMALNTLSFFDTDTLQTINVLFDEADDRGILRLSVPVIAAGRGLTSTINKKTRDRFNAQIDLLKEVEFRVHRYSKRGKELPTGHVPMINQLVDWIDPDTGERVDGVYQINPILWGDMNQGGRFLLLDRRVAKLNAKNDEWIIRLHWYLAARWANQKPTDFTSGVPQAIAVETMLNGAGIEYQKQLNGQGQLWLEDRVTKSLDQMQTSDLIGSYNIRKKAGRTFLDARVTCCPPAGLLNQVEYRRSKLLSVTRKALADGTTPKQIKQKAEK
jgi:hypothetical protein